jgi:hypothetical protein
MGICNNLPQRINSIVKEISTALGVVLPEG